MILSAPFPCRIKGVPAGGSKSRTFSYWTTVDVLVPTLDERELVLAAEIVTGRGRIHREPDVDRYYAMKGKPGLYRACDTPLRNLGTAPAKSLDLLPENSRDILPRRPALRTIEHDHEREDVARVQRKFNESFVCGGVLYVPAAEPYLHVYVQQKAESRVHIEYFRRKNMDGNIRSFRLPDMERAFELALANRGDPARIDWFKRQHEISIFDPAPFRYEPANGEIVYATRMVLEMHEAVLPKMTISEATSWFLLRDEADRWASDETSDPEAVVCRCQEALRAFDRYNRFEAATLLEINEVLDRALENLVDQDLVDYAASLGKGF